MACRDLGRLLDKHGYKEIKQIGEGSFGKAVLVQGAKGKLVCKTVDVSRASPKETQDAVKEGQLLAQFKHPYIVRYRESFIESGLLCILMDFCEGGDLAAQIERAKRKSEPIREEQVLTWLTQAMLALKYIHEMHVLHRDLKASNFFLSKDNTLKMGDFGIAKVLSSTVACARTQIGTPYYMSPEICQERPYGWHADIWAMGVILYEMCERKVPFDAANIAGLVNKIVKGPTPVIRGGYSECVVNLCSEMLNRNEKLRPSADVVLQRPYMQAVVRKMLEDKRGHSDPNVARGESPSVVDRGRERAGSKPSSARPSARDPSPSGRDKPPSSRGPSPCHGGGPAAHGDRGAIARAPPGMPRAPSKDHRSGTPASPPQSGRPSRLGAAGGMAVGH